MEKELAPSVKKWLSRLAPSTSKGYKKHLKKFISWLKENGDEFADKGPDELVSYMEDATRKEQYRLLDKVQEYISSLKGLRRASMAIFYSAIRSFFSHNRVELPKDPTYTIRSDIKPTKGDLTIENIYDIVKTSTPAYSATFLCMLQSGMGLGEFYYWNLHGWESLQKDLKEGKSFITIDQPGRKKKKNVKPYSTYIMGDAKDALLEYLPYRKLAREKFDRSQKLRRAKAEKRGEKYVEKKFNPNAIFYNNFGEPLTGNSTYHYWLRQCVRLKIIIKKGDSNPRNRYGKSPHEIRDVFRSQWEKTTAKPSVAEFMMGHTIDPLGYNKACRDIPWVIREIRKALPMLNIMSSNVPFGLVSIDEYEDELQKAYKEIERLTKKQYSADSDMSDLRTEMDDIKLEFTKLRNNLEGPI